MPGSRIVRRSRVVRDVEHCVRISHGTDHSRRDIETENRCLKTALRVVLRALRADTTGFFARPHYRNPRHLTLRADAYRVHLFRQILRRLRIASPILGKILIPVHDGVLLEVELDVAEVAREDVEPDIRATNLQAVPDDI